MQKFVRQNFDTYPIHTFASKTVYLSPIQILSKQNIYLLSMQKFVRQNFDGTARLVNAD